LPYRAELSTHSTGISRSPATALALGRDDDEIGEFLTGENEVDDDLLMKIRGIAQQRHIDIGAE